MSEELRKLWKTEDYWAVWLGLGIVVLALFVFWSGSTIAGWAVTPGSWSDVSELGADAVRAYLMFVAPPVLVVWSGFHRLHGRYGA